MRSDRLAWSGGLTIVSKEGASPTTLSVLGGPSTGIPSSKDAQASLKVSWAAPPKARRASEARSGDSKATIVGLF